jgi:hypothetical protein
MAPQVNSMAHDNGAISAFKANIPVKIPPYQRASVF